MNLVISKLMGFMEIGYPELTEKQRSLKIQRWLNMPNTHLLHLTPKELCESGREVQVLNLIDTFLTGE